MTLIAECQGSTPYHPGNLLICAVGGRVYGLERYTGSVVWKTRISSRNSLISLFCDVAQCEVLYAGVKGKLFALSCVDGTMLLKDKLLGMGYEDLSIAVLTSKPTLPPYSPHTGHSSSGDLFANAADSRQFLNSMVFVGSHGNVRGLDLQSGQLVWENRLSGGGRGLPTLLFDLARQLVYVGAGNKVFGLNCETGETVWERQLKQSSVYVTMILPEV
ncbi:hypothetical protein K493DRAFT_311660 [Basidiobolus meristosporus CBS 931.73]|uniref:Pyrrolo-quinoline quinone repeat domain-containing protein n=1 Tax=Basidiobolus meristosporus CBS 931.73 TaxID=1314790 RepID=A0A1Y1Z1C8_9FUNG|nr:hypothetical protein K493DRAFT_311660 [Basidiobolus meristosporus CBS 931.73]|eukprot:ORY03635.1 hypothetical protein K493DRAFT_311660 [Basidiobolus meristosporus CBS 931.73]